MAVGDSDVWLEPYWAEVVGVVEPIRGGSLDRDDRGLFQDRITLDGVEISNPLNQETISILHYYQLMLSKHWSSSRFIKNIIK